MNGTTHPPFERDGGDPPCWSHLLDDARADIVDRSDIERLVRNFYRNAAMDDVLGPVFEAVGASSGIEDCEFFPIRCE